MKLVHKINLVNTVGIVFIVFAWWSASQNLNTVLTKVRFTEIAEDLNASFLEMRLSEKNYFLYNDRSALRSIRKKLDQSVKTIESVKTDIIKATGQKNYNQLRHELEIYRKTISEIREGDLKNDRILKRVRDTGQSLREFSSRTTHLERNQMNKIINQSKKGLFYSFCLILICAIGISYTFAFNITRSLKRVAEVAYRISKGDFFKVEKVTSKDEIGSVLNAMNFMVYELQKREEQNIQSRKLASIGILTAGVAHELGNPLNNISMMAQAYVEVYEDLAKEERIAYMEQIEEETDRIKDIVKNLLDFSRPKKPDLAQMNVNSIVKKSITLVQNMIHVSEINVQSEYYPDLPDIVIDRSQIQEVLINILTNSIQATSPGGNLTISTNLNEADEMVEVLIEDNGKGIPADLLPHLFDPFFTTKGSGGVGLGLFVSYGIIKNHQGNIFVDSTEGAGTRFKIELPLHRKEKEEEEVMNDAI